MSHGHIEFCQLAPIYCRAVIACTAAIPRNDGGVGLQLADRRALGLVDQAIQRYSIAALRPHIELLSDDPEQWKPHADHGPCAVHLCEHWEWVLLEATLAIRSAEQRRVGRRMLFRLTVDSPASCGVLDFGFLATVPQLSAGA
jgi:hypothetical protein